VRVKRQVVGFKKIKFYTLENLGAGLLQLPELEMHTTAFWLRFSSAFFQGFSGYTKSDLQDVLRALANILRTIGSVMLLTDPRDLAVAVLDESLERPDLFEPDLVLYDNYPGGIGLSHPLFQRRAELLNKALSLACSCPCSSGCPACVGAPNEIGELGRKGCIQLLRTALSEPLG
jgi:DEAD/DEAH box helicase domain-containing protein